MKVKKYALILGAALLMLAGCKPAVNPVQPGNQESGQEEEQKSGIVDGKFVPLTAAVNPKIGDGKRKKSLQYIFSTESVGESEIYIKRSEWNKMLEYYDYFYKNENTVAVEQFTYKKDGMEWDLINCGMRLRGNTSRFRPQGKDSPTDETGHTMPNGAWSSGYYDYAANCPDSDYRQSHFKVDFEPYDAKQKLAGCMKGVALKRMDAAYAREILCYDLFHENDVFSATRASHTKVTIYMIEEDNSVTAVDYGIYEMFEEVNDQFIKARDESDPNAEHTFTHWASTDGDLWKCGGNLTPSDVNSRAGVENICITSNGVEIEPGETKAKSTWDFVWEGYGYDLKTNKKKLSSAKSNLMTFANELEALRNLPKNEEGIAARKTFYEKWFDMDLFLTTYAVNVAVGMDDDYWGNANNYYLYFDNGEGGTNKCFLIPFDYDNTLGQSINGDGVYNNPLDWGWSQSRNYRNDRPLMDRLLEVPEYRTAYKQKLLEVTAEDSAWSMGKSGTKVTKWQNMVIANDTDGNPLTYSEDLNNTQALNALYWIDYGGWKSVKHYLNAEPNIYDQVRESFRNWITLDGGISIEFDFNGGTGTNPETGISTTNPVSVQLDDSMFHSMIEISLNDLMPIPSKDGYIFAGWTKTKDGDDFVSNKFVSKVYAKWSDKVLLHSTKINGTQFNLNKYEPYKDLTLEIKVSFDKEKTATTEGDGDWAGFGFSWSKYLKSWWIPKDNPRESFTEIFKFRYDDLRCLYEACTDSGKEWGFKLNSMDDDRAYSAEIYVTAEEPDIRISFNSNGGSALSDSFIFKDTDFDYSNLLESKIPEKAGDTFVCWFFDSGLTVPVSFDGLSETTITETTIYACFVDSKYKTIYKLKVDNEIEKYWDIPVEDLITSLPTDGEVYDVEIVANQIDKETEVRFNWGAFVSGARIDGWWKNISELDDRNFDNSQVSSTGEFKISFTLNTKSGYLTTNISDMYIRMGFSNDIFPSGYIPIASITITKRTE